MCSSSGFPSHRGAVLNDLDSPPRLAERRKRAGPVRRARRREQADDISCSEPLCDIHNSRNKLKERTLFAGFGDRFACPRFLRITASPLLFFFKQENIGAFTAEGLSDGS